MNNIINYNPRIRLNPRVRLNRHIFNRYAYLKYKIRIFNYVFQRSICNFSDF